MAAGIKEPYIAILGASLETRNRGVSALALSLVRLCRKFRPDCELVFLAANRSGTVRKIATESGETEIPLINCRFSPTSSLRENIFAILAAAFLWRFLRPFGLNRAIESLFPYLKVAARASIMVDIWGGDSFSDIYGKVKFLKGALERFIPVVLGKPIRFAPQTFGPYKGLLTRAIARLLLIRAEFAYARDFQSLERAKELLGKSRTKKLGFCPDVAFTLPRSSFPQEAFFPPLPSHPSFELIGLNPSGLLYHGGYRGKNDFSLKIDYPRFVCELAEKLLEKENRHLALIPHTFGEAGEVESDPTACKAVYESLSPSAKPRAHLLVIPLDPCQAKAAIGLCSVFLGSRMHACIAALSQGIPAFGISYSPKFSGLYASLGLEDMVIEATSLGTEAALQKALDLVNNAHLYTEKVQAASVRAVKLVEENFKRLLSVELRSQCVLTP